MKKIVAFLIAFLLMFLQGCSTQTPPEPVLDFTALMYIDGTEYLDGVYSLEAEIAFSVQGATSITVTTPDELWGLCYKWNDGFEISYNQLHCQTEKGYLPDECFAQAVYSVLTALSQDTVCDDFKEGIATFSGECGSGHYIVTTDSDGYIQNISVEELSLAVDFTYD